MCVTKLLLIALRLTKRRTLGLDVMKSKIMLGFKFFIFFLDMRFCMSSLWHLEFGKVRAEFEDVLGPIFWVLEKIFEGIIK